MLTANNFQAFKNARFNIQVLKQIYAWANEEDRKVMLKAGDGNEEGLHIGEYYLFMLSAGDGTLDVLRQLYAWVPEAEREKMLKSGERGGPGINGYSYCYAFNLACLRDRLEVVKQLYAWASVEFRSSMVDNYGYHYHFMTHAHIIT